MSTYKVIQDIEAEDKLVGPLSLRQFIYAGVGAICLYICFLAYTRHAVFLVGIFLPIAAICTFFAFPWKGEQPTEIWALARLRFMIKPRVRIWNQTGTNNLVTISAPRKVEAIRPKTNNLSETEVQSRLKALADTIDSRGWATRNAAYSRYTRQGQVAANSAYAGTANLQPGAVPSEAFAPSNDMFDEQNSVAQNFDSLLNRSTQNQRQRVMQQMQQVSAPAPAYRPPMPAPAQAPAAAYSANPFPGLPAMQPQSPQLPAPVMPAALAPHPAMPAPSQPQPYAASQPPAASNAWFMSNPSYPPNAASPAPKPAAAAPAQNVFFLPGEVPLQTGPLPMPTAAAPTAADEQASAQIKANMPPEQAINYGHMKVLQPLGGEADANAPAAAMPPMGPMGPMGPMPQPAAIDYGTAQVGTPAYASAAALPPAAAQPAEPVTRKPDPAILELANNDDLDVATIARQASKEIRKSPDEVEIRLH